jgi:hypothetical protein
MAAILVGISLAESYLTHRLRGRATARTHRPNHIWSPPLTKIFCPVTNRVPP